jgi:hypothetical protein
MEPEVKHSRNLIIQRTGFPEDILQPTVNRDNHPCIAGMKTNWRWYKGTSDSRNVEDNLSKEMLSLRRMRLSIVNIRSIETRDSTESSPSPIEPEAKV